MIQSWAALSAMSTDWVRSARGGAHLLLCAQKLQLDRRSRASLSDQPVSRDRRETVRGHADLLCRHDCGAFPRLREQRLCAGEVPRRLKLGPHLGLAAEPRRRRPQPEDRLEPDAYRGVKERRALQRNCCQDCWPNAGAWYGSAARRLVRRSGAHPADRRENPSLRLARSQGLVAAGAGDPGLSDLGRVHKSRNT